MKGALGRGTLEKEKPPILGLIQRGGEVILHMLANVQQATIHPIIEKTIAKGTLIHTDEYDIYARLEDWGYVDKTVCHAHGEYARDDDGDGFCEVHVNTIEDFGRRRAPGYVPMAASPKRNCPPISASSSSFTTLVSAERLSRRPRGRPRHLIRHHPGSRKEPQNHARCDNQASLPAVSVVQRKLHPGIMMSGCQAGVKPGPFGPCLWRLRA